ncbi:MAG TPA: hypothetical protein PLL00_08885, partial [Bacteroidia bacterium]|nr:hypothetical protein [Bacteroidia bacterium]
NNKINFEVFSVLTHPTTLMVERNLAYLERLKNGAPSKGNPARIHEREVYFKYKKDYLRRKSISHH